MLFERKKRNYLSLPTVGQKRSFVLNVARSIIRLREVSTRHKSTGKINVHVNYRSKERKKKGGKKERKKEKKKKRRQTQNTVLIIETVPLPRNIFFSFLLFPPTQFARKSIRGVAAY